MVLGLPGSRQREPDRGARLRAWRVDADAPAVELHDLLRQRQADTGASIDVARVQPLEDHENLVDVLRIDTDAVVGDRDLPLVADLFGGHHDARGHPLAVELQPVADQVDEERAQQRRVAAHHRQRLDARSCRRRRCARAPAGPSAAATTSSSADLGERGRGAPDPGEREQVVDQLLHALGAVDRERDVLVGAVVELARVAALQELAEARDLAQRLLQVVARHVGELLEVAVGPLQVLGLVVEALVGLPGRLQLVQDRQAHRVDVGAQLDDLPRAVGHHRVRHVAGRDRPHLRRQVRHRPQHRAAQPEGGRDEEARDHHGDPDPHPGQPCRRGGEAVARGHPLGVEVGLQRCRRARGRRRRAPCPGRRSGAGGCAVEQRLRVARLRQASAAASTAARSRGDRRVVAGTRGSRGWPPRRGPRPLGPACRGRGTRRCRRRGRSRAPRSPGRPGRPGRFCAASTAGPDLVEQRGRARRTAAAAPRRRARWRPTVMRRGARPRRT